MPIEVLLTVLGTTAVLIVVFGFLLGKFYMTGEPGQALIVNKASMVQVSGRGPVG